MAVQQLIVNTAYTCPIVFLDPTLSQVKGPVGLVTASDPSVTVGLSADGQSCNVMMTTAQPVGAQPVTITWHDPSTGTPPPVPDFTMQVTDVPVALPAASGSFGPLAVGNTP